MENITVPGYPYPIGARFDPRMIDTSSGEPIVHARDGYWVWGRGCTQPGGGIVPAWGFVRVSRVGIEQARNAKETLRDKLNRPAWLRGVGIGIDKQGSHLVRVMVAEMTDEVRQTLPEQVNGVPVEIDVTGDFEPSNHSSGPTPPTSPPPFGRPEGHLGGSYDWWWWNLGRQAGVPYEPNGRRNRVVGFGQEEILVPLAAAAAHPSPWAVALATTVLGAATGWVIEEVARRVRGPRK